MQLEDFSKITFRKRAAETSGSVAEGLRWAVLGHAVLAVITLGYGLMVIALLQLSYILPLVGVFHRLDRRKSMLGAALAALLGLVINAVALFVFSYGGRPW